MNNIVIITFFLPQVIAGIYFIIIFNHYLALYRKKKNPDYPLLPNETKKYFYKHPIKFITHSPLVPFLIWKKLFETHADSQLNLAARKARMSLLIFGIVMIVTFFINALAMYFKLIS